MPPRNWRFRCPEGHASWTPCPNNEPERTIRCKHCDKYWGHLRDMKTGKLVNRTEMRA